MADEASCSFDGDWSEQETPPRTQDSPSRWPTANHRKRVGLSHLEREATQRDSQETQVKTEVATQPVESLAPVFINTWEEKKENEEDEQETQICMTNFDDQNEKPDQMIVEEKVLEQIAPIEGWTYNDARTGSSGDNDSGMSDDMLEQDGCAARLSMVPASFQRKKEPLIVPKIFNKPRTPIQASFAPCPSPSSSGGETEIESESKEEFPTNYRVVKTDMNQALFKDSLTPIATQSPKYSKSNVKDGYIPADTTFQLHSLLKSSATSSASLLPNCLKRGESALMKDTFARTKRSRYTKEETHLNSLDQKTLPENLSAVRKSELEHTNSHRYGRNKAPRKSQSDYNNRSNVVKLEEKSTPISLESSPFQPLVPPANCGKMRAANSHLITHRGKTSAQTEDNIRIIITGIEPTAAIRKKIKAISGAVYERNIANATHVIASQHQLKRTVKFLCGISCCKHILDEHWLDESARIGAPIDEQTNCLYDKEAEEKWHFDLKSTMYGVPAEQRRSLLAGVSVFITNHKSILPPVKDLVKIVECAGGKASFKGKPKANELVITSEAALSGATARKQLASTNPDQIYTSELILSSILRQRVELDKHRLKLSGIGKT